MPFTLTPLRRSLAALALVPLAAVALLPAATAASASQQSKYLNLNFTVDVTTHLAKLNQDVTVPQGTFMGKLNTSTGAVNGTLALPPAQSTVSLVGIGLATATLQLQQTKPVHGLLDLHTSVLTTTSTFNIDITSLTPVGTTINLVGSNCATVKPVVLTISGPVNIFGPSTFTGSYTIPNFANCQLATIPINLLIPGPGNTLVAQFTPVTG